MPEVHSRSLMMIEAVVQGQIQAMEVTREREFVLKDHEATQTGGVETMIHRRGVYQYPMMIMFLTISNWIVVQKIMLLESSQNLLLISL